MKPTRTEKALLAVKRKRDDAMARRVVRAKAWAASEILKVLSDSRATESDKCSRIQVILWDMRTRCSTGRKLADIHPASTVEQVRKFEPNGEVYE